MKVDNSCGNSIQFKKRQSKRETEIERERVCMSFSIGRNGSCIQSNAIPSKSIDTRLWLLWKTCKSYKSYDHTS